MKSKILFFLTISLITSALNAQSNKSKFILEIDAPYNKGQTAYLLNYWNEATYISDSCQISEQGKGLLQSKQSLPTGQYVLYIKPDVQLEMLLDEKDENVKISVSKDILSSKIKGSKDTQIFWGYIKQIDTYNKDKKSSQDPELIDKRVNDYTHKVISDNKGLWVSDFIKGATPIVLPYTNPKDEKEAIENSRYMKKHYFDHVPLTDPRLLRTNYFWSYLDNYLENWVSKDVDSLAQATTDLVARSMENQTCFEQILMRYLNKAINSKQMGMENVWAKLAEDYIFDKNYAKVDSTEITALRSQYELIKYNRIGMIAHGLRLETLEGDTIQLHDVEAKYTILYFYDPTCGHCLTETKSIQNNLYPKYKDKGLKIVTVNIHNNKEMWENYVKQNNISDWINCADPNHRSKYWIYYNTSGVPSAYVLDNDKKIIAKGIDEKGLEQVFNYLYKEDGTN